MVFCVHLRSYPTKDVERWGLHSANGILQDLTECMWPLWNIEVALSRNSTERISEIIRYFIRFIVRFFTVILLLQKLCSKNFTPKFLNSTAALIATNDQCVLPRQINGDVKLLSSDEELITKLNFHDYFRWMVSHSLWLPLIFTSRPSRQGQWI